MFFWSLPCATPAPPAFRAEAPEEVVRRRPRLPPGRDLPERPGARGAGAAGGSRARARLGDRRAPGTFAPPSGSRAGCATAAAAPLQRLADAGGGPPPRPPLTRSEPHRSQPFRPGSARARPCSTRLDPSLLDPSLLDPALPLRSEPLRPERRRSDVYPIRGCSIRISPIRSRFPPIRAPCSPRRRQGAGRRRAHRAGRPGGPAARGPRRSGRRRALRRGGRPRRLPKVPSLLRATSLKSPRRKSGLADRSGTCPATARPARTRPTPTRSRPARARAPRSRSPTSRRGRST